jgi:hypothetical protein
MRYLLIPLTDTALSIGAVTPQLEARDPGDEQRYALAQAFERTILTAELLVTYAVGRRWEAVETVNRPSCAVACRPAA